MVTPCVNSLNSRMNTRARILTMMDASVESSSSSYTMFERTYPINRYVHMVDVTLNECHYLEMDTLPPRSSHSDSPLAIRFMCERDTYYQFSQNEPLGKVRVGICARNSKVFSKPMKEIIARILEYSGIEVIIIPDDIIKNVSIDYWPIVEALLSFYSFGFPLEKAIRYAKLRKPYLLNDLKMQYILQDRMKTYQVLEREGIEIPRHAFVLRDDNTNEPLNVEITELEDGLKIDDQSFTRPFVEKPINADDHTVCIYYPSMMGGGCQRLFRKIGNRSSIFIPSATWRGAGSYIYEEFLTTDGSDVKVYSVGLDYAHAEARKSPSLDGIVERDKEGKEVRYPVLLSIYEKLIASKITRAFKQTVCGFDLLRTKGRSVVCDVNGFSFVKKSKKYYDDCSNILVKLILENTFSNLLVPRSIPWRKMEETLKKHVTKPPQPILELRCVISVIRHGDRTPKQKMKMVVQHEKFIELFKKYGGCDEPRVKLKTAMQLQEVLDITRELILLHETTKNQCLETKHKLLQMKFVLEMYDHFSGFNRKVQLKSLTDERNSILHYKFKGHIHHESIPENMPSLLLILKWGGELTKYGIKQSENLGVAYRHFYPNQRDKLYIETKTTDSLNPINIKLIQSKLGSNVTLVDDNSKKIATSDNDSTPQEENNTCDEQAEVVASSCNQNKTNENHDGNNGSNGGNGGNVPGLLRLHSTYRHDLKIYASDEGRVQLTAASFAKGFLALESERTPIMVHLVNTDKESTKMLDASNGAEFLLQDVKSKLHQLMKKDHVLTSEDLDEFAPTKNKALLESLKNIVNPRAACQRLYDHLVQINKEIRDVHIQNCGIECEAISSNSRIGTKCCFVRDRDCESNDDKSGAALYHNETFILMERRWGKLEKDFKHRDGSFAISLIPDIYDCAKFDYLHNKHLKLASLPTLYKVSKSLASAVIPLEYGISAEQKFNIGRSVCKRLLRKIMSDLDYVRNEDETHHRLASRGGYETDVVSPHRQVRSRFYFTSESHIYGLFNSLFHGGLLGKSEDQGKFTSNVLSRLHEFDFLSQIVIIQYEDPLAPLDSNERFRVEIFVSSGDRQTNIQLQEKGPLVKKSQSQVSIGYTGSSAPPKIKRTSSQNLSETDNVTGNNNKVKSSTSKITEPNPSGTNTPTEENSHDRYKIKKKIRRTVKFKDRANVSASSYNKDDTAPEDSSDNDLYDENACMSNEYDSDGDVQGRRKSFDQTIAKYELRKPSKEHDWRNYRGLVPSLHPLHPLGKSMTLKQMMDFLNSIT